MDFTQSFLQGVQQGQQRASAQKRQEQESEEFDLKKQMLKVEMQKLDIAQKIAARKAAEEGGENWAKRDAPAQVQPTGGVTTTGGPMPAVNMGMVNPAQVPVDLPEAPGMPAVQGAMYPTLTGMRQAKTAEADAAMGRAESLSKVFVPGRGFVDREVFTAEEQTRRAAEKAAADAAALEARLGQSEANISRQIAAQSANVDKQIASREKIERDRRASESQDSLPPDHEDVTFLLTGGTVDKLSVRTRSRAVEAAKAAGGIQGTGFVPTNATQLTKFSFLYGDALAKAQRLKQLLEDPKTSAELKSKLGPVMGRLVQGTKEWSYIGQNTAVKEAFDLFKDLSDSELRERSGAAISPGEYDRIVGFTIDPTKQFDSNKTNLNRMINKITEELKVMGATRLGGSAPTGLPTPPAATPAPSTGTRPRRRNPTTGEVIEFDGAAWVPVKQ